MSSRGRGYGGRGSYGGRGGYRGNSYRGSNNRGSYESRGRGNYNSHYNDNRYTSSSNERYNSGRERIDDSYKKPYRSESTSYSGREYMSRGGSPDRKRMRIEGSGDRRSHDGGGHFGSSYGGRPESYGERRSFGEERRRSPSRDGYRKSVMAPPRSPTRMSAPRSRVMRVSRSYRGRTLRTRSTYRGSLRARASYFPRRFGDRTSEYTRSFRINKMRSTIKTKVESASSTEGEDWDTEKEGAEDEVKEAKSKSPKPAEKMEAVDAGGDTDKEGGEAASDDDNLPRSKFTGKKFISLYCLHCKEKYITFGGYAKHLLSGKHRASMGAVARRHKAQLLRMRMAQRNAQRELEENEDAELTAETTYCLVCKLNYRTTKLAHSKTEAHAAMKRFLMPSCKVCRINFRSPMIYEHHICSLDHIKRKARNNVTRPASPKVDRSGDEGMDVDLDNFMTLDSVGDVDEVDDEDSGAEKKADDGTKPPKKEINIGSEHIKKVEVYWCELCKMYLRRVESAAEEVDVLRRHCRVRTHLSHYVRHRDTRTLRKQAERIHRQLQRQRENAKDETTTEDKEEKQESEKKSVENGTEISGNGIGEDKLWADVDKDIGELLREVDPSGAKSSDDEEDLGRYDKFRKSDKKLDGAGDTETEKAGVTVEPVEAADVAAE